MSDMDSLNYGPHEIYTIGGAAIAFISWCVRLESKTAQAGKDLEKLEGRVVTLEHTLGAKLSSIEKSLAKIEGRLSIKQHGEES